MNAGELVLFVAYSDDERKALPGYGYPFHPGDELRIERVHGEDHEPESRSFIVVRVSDGHRDMVWPEEVQPDTRAQLRLFA